MRPLFAMVALLMVSGSAQALPVMLFDDPGGDGFTSRSDLRMVLLEDEGPRILVAAVMQEPGPAAGGDSQASQSDLRFEVHFRLASGAAWVNVTLVALVDATDHDLEARFGAKRITSHGLEDLPVQGLVRNGSLVWTFLAADIPLPAGPWELSHAYAFSRAWLGAPEENLESRTGLRPTDQTEDRAPDDGYGPPTKVAGQQPPAADNPAPAPEDLGANEPQDMAPAVSPDTTATPREPIGAGILVAALVAALAALARWEWPGLLALFSRIDRKEALLHPRRAAIHQTVEEEPGITFVELRRRLAIGSGSLAHHLGILEKQGLVRTVQDGRRRAFRCP